MIVPPVDKENTLITRLFLTSVNDFLYITIIVNDQWF